MQGTSRYNQAIRRSCIRNFVVPSIDVETETPRAAEASGHDELGAHYLQGVDYRDARSAPEVGLHTGLAGFDRLRESISLLGEMGRHLGVPGGLMYGQYLPCPAEVKRAIRRALENLKW